MSTSNCPGSGKNQMSHDTLIFRRNGSLHSRRVYVIQILCQTAADLIYRQPLHPDMGATT